MKKIYTRKLLKNKEKKTIYNMQKKRENCSAKK